MCKLQTECSHRHSKITSNLAVCMTGHDLTADRRKQRALQKATFQALKGHLLRCKRRQTARQKTANRNTPANPLVFSALQNGLTTGSRDHANRHANHTASRHASTAKIFIHKGCTYRLRLVCHPYLTDFFTYGYALRYYICSVLWLKTRKHNENSILKPKH